MNCGNINTFLKIVKNELQILEKIMKKILINSLIYVVFFISCVTYSNEGKVNQIDSTFIMEEINKPSNMNKIIQHPIVNIKGYEFLKDQEDKQAAAELREPNYKTINNCHMIIIILKTYYDRAAFGNNWLFIVQDANGQEIYRNVGKNNNSYNSKPATNTYPQGEWRNTEIIFLDKNVKCPLNIRIVNNVLSDLFWDYKISENIKS